MNIAYRLEGWFLEVIYLTAAFVVVVMVQSVWEPKSNQEVKLMVPLASMACSNFLSFYLPLFLLFSEVFIIPPSVLLIRSMASYWGCEGAYIVAKFP